MMLRRLAPLTLALAVAVGVAWWFAGPVSAPQLPAPIAAADAQTADAAQFDQVPDMRKGDPDAPVTVIEYASFTCPHCANFHRNVFPQLQAEFVDTGQVQWIKREVYFDRPGLWAAMLARCGGDSRYFPMVDLIYETQRDWAASSDPSAIAENLRSLGRRTGLTNEEVDVCLMDAEQAQAMVAVYQHNATEHGISSTPSFVVDGELHSNMGLDAFRALLSARLGG